VTTGIHWQDDVAFPADSVVAQLFHGRLDQSVGHYTMSVLMSYCVGASLSRGSLGAMLGVCTCQSTLAASHGVVSVPQLCECGTAAAAVVN
jgi:hypothetical protein